MIEATMDTKLNLSVVIPVYRSEATLPELNERLIAAISALNLSFEIIYVDDNGGDNSWNVIQKFAEADSRIKGYSFSRNFGQHAATICGISHSVGEWVVTLDDDLEQLPEYIGHLYKHALSGFDLVYGIYEERTHSTWRNATSSLAKYLFKKAIPSLSEHYTSFRMIRGDIARALDKFDTPYPFIDGYLSWITNNTSCVTVPHGSRANGVSNYTFKKLLHHTINIFATFSDLPLKLATWMGLFCFMAGSIWIVYLLTMYSLGAIKISGYASLMAAILAFGGVQFLILGIFGEYLGRMNFSLSKKPHYLIRENTKTATFK